MKYREYESAFVKCPECGGFIDEDSMLCKKCGYDMFGKDINGRPKRTQARNSERSPKHHKNVYRSM